MTWTPKLMPRHAYAVTKHVKHDGDIDAPIVDVRDDLDYRDDNGVSMPVITISAFAEEASDRAQPVCRLEFDPITALWLRDVLEAAVEVAMKHYDWNPELDHPGMPRFGESKRSAHPRLMQGKRKSNQPKNRVRLGDDLIDDELDVESESIDE